MSGDGKFTALTMPVVLFTLAAGLATLGALGDVAWMLSLAGLALCGFILLEVRRIQRPQLVAALVLLAVAVGLSLWQGHLFETFYKGVLKTLPFLLIFASVGWLRAAAGESPSVLALREGLAQMQPGHRFAAISASAHIMGAGFNLAGMGLLAPILDDVADDPVAGRRLRCAILWGFSTAASWSPFLVGTAVVLSVLPGVTWFQMMPYGVFIAIGFLIWAIVYDRLRYPRGTRVQAAPLDLRRMARPAGRMVVAILLLFALTMSLIQIGGLALTTAIAISAPSFGLAWLWLTYGRAQSDRIGQIASGVLRAYPAMRTESTLFVAANVFGVAIQGALPESHGDGAWIQGPTGIYFVDSLLVIWLYLAVCALGFHPVILLVVFTSLMDPAALGVPLPVLGAVMMTLWGMGTSVSPLSGTTLFMSQLSPQSSFTIAWRWNGLFYALGAVWLATAICLVT